MPQEEALQDIQAFRELLVSGQASFADLAGRESHCSSAKRGGDLGEFGPGQMQKPFEDATYALKVIASSVVDCLLVGFCCQSGIEGTYSAGRWAS